MTINSKALKAVPLNKISGIEFLPTENSAVVEVNVLDQETRWNLSWDRYVRLKACAEVVKNATSKNASILDVGGFDGALALFLADYKIHMIDKETTGVSILEESLASQSYDIVTAVDVLEHIEPNQRERALKEMARIAKKCVILNYPCTQSRKAQEIVLRATNNELVNEHVQWDLPNSKQVMTVLAEFGFTSKLKEHSNLAIWLGQYIMLNLVPEKACDLNRYLIEHHADEPFSTPLYHLVVSKRK